MRVFVAGATGAAGIPTVRALVAAGHDVTGVTRSASKIEMLERLGAAGFVADVLEPAAIAAAVSDAKPDAVVQLLTALPERGPMKESDLAATSRLRVEGTRNLLAAAVEAGARRYVSESIVLGYAGAGHETVTESSPFARTAPGYPFAPALEALASLEEQLFSEPRIEAVVLRLGLYYGPTSGSTRFMIRMAKRRLLALPRDNGLVPWIHLDDAATAIVAAPERGRGVYNIVDDEPAGVGEFARTLTDALGVSRPKRLPLWLARIAAPYMSQAVTLRLESPTRKPSTSCVGGRCIRRSARGFPPRSARLPSEREGFSLGRRTSLRCA